MGKKKGFFASLFGSDKSGDCCTMEIVEELKKKSGCCDMKMVEEETACCSGESTVQMPVSDTEQANILILGPGCKNCQALEANVKEALKKMKKDNAIGHITDFDKIASYGIMSTPGLVVNGKVVSYGKVLKSDTIINILEKNL